MSTAANHLRLIKAVLQSTLPVATASLRQNFIHILSSVSGSNTITATAFPGIAAYTYPTVVVIIPATTNTAATTLNADTRGAIAVQNIDGTACVGGELVAGIPALLLLNSGATAFVIQSPANARLIPFIQKSANYTIAQADTGTTVYFSGTGLTITLPTTPLPLGAWLKIRNNGSGNHTLSSTQTITWYNGSSIPTGSRTLAVGATIFVQSDGTNYSIEGAGIS